MLLCILLIKYLHNMHHTPLLKIPLWQWFNEKLIKYLQRDIGCSLNKKKKKMKVAIIKYLLFIIIINTIIINIIITTIIIMLIASTKSRSVRGASNQPAFMSSRLTISHMFYLPYLPNG